MSVRFDLVSAHQMRVVHMTERRPQGLVLGVLYQHSQEDAHAVADLEECSPEIVKQTGESDQNVLNVR